MLDLAPAYSAPRLTLALAMAALALASVAGATAADPVGACGASPVVRY